MSAETVELRNCTTLDDFRACLVLQQEIWGFSDVELVPLRVFSLAPKIGGQVVGAWDGSTMIGFALAIPGSRNGHSYLHSHMVGVREAYRNIGLGRRIKLFQREEAITRGFELMEWTFDPLEIKNSYFNLDRLGAIARRYNINQYGITSSPLQGFLPTDRLVAEWWLTSNQARSVLAGKPPGFEPELRIVVPAQVYSWKSQPATRNRAADLQLGNRNQFLTAFSKGLACLGYERDTNGNGAFLLGRWNECWSYATKG